MDFEKRATEALENLDAPYNELLLRLRNFCMVRGMVEMGRVIRATNNVKNRMPIASMTVVAHGTEEKNVAETMKDLILEELNVEEMKFLEDESSLVECSAKPNFLNIKSDFSSYFGQPFL